MRFTWAFFIAFMIVMPAMAEDNDVPFPDLGVSDYLGAIPNMFGIRLEEEPGYDVLEKHGDIEIRRYAPLVLAETKVEGDYDTAKGQAFRILADYLFGNNSANDKMSMTAPVMQRGEAMSMTAPVLQKPMLGGWIMQFVLPSNYTFATAPQPNDNRVKLLQQREKIVATLRYSGTVDPDVLAEKTAALQDWLRSQQLEAVSAPWSAQYDPPFAIPFLKRNEIHIEITG